MQNRHKANRKGNALVEFALVMLVAIPLMLGTTFLGFAMGNNIQAIQISRDVAHMYAKGVDFSAAQNSDVAVRLAQGYDLSPTGNSVLILSQIMKVFPADCAAAGYSSAQCPNLNQNVFVNRLVIGNASLQSSAFSSPNPAYLNSLGNISAANYLTKSDAIATGFSSTMTQQAGAIAYVAEVFVPVPDFNFNGRTSGGKPGVFVRAIF